MELLKTVNNATARLKENAADGSMGATSIAVAATPLFASMVKRSVPTVKQPDNKTKAKKKKSLGLQEAFDDMGAMAPVDPASTSPRSSSTPSFDSNGVVSKLKGLENKEKQDYRDTVSFGLEDDKGGLVRVSVRTEQAQDFEKALQSFLSDEDSLEVAEILFKLRSHFDIVDVQWPAVEEDEEEDIAVGQPSDPAALPSDDNMIGPDAGEVPPTGEDQATSMLAQVIDMMKADAEARKAEAHARTAEAKTKEAESVVNQAMAKVKQEEQFLDMDTYNKSQKDGEREAKRLAQLAKWKHDMSKEQGVSDQDVRNDEMGGMPPQGSPEEEEYTTVRATPTANQPRKAPATRVRPQEVADFILNRVKK